MGMGEGTCHSDVGVVVADECNRCDRQYDNTLRTIIAKG